MTKLVAIAIVAGLAGTATADNKTEAAEHKAKAAEAYKAGNWQVVLDELGKANELDPDPNLNFSMGQVYVKMGRCDEAKAAYDKFLASNPGGDFPAMAKEAIDACVPAAPPPPPETPPEKPPELPSQPPPPTDHGTTGRWYQDRLGVGLVGGGGAMILLGGVLYLSARGTLSDAEDAATYGEQVDKYDSAKSKRTLGVVFGLGGAALVGVGVYHYMKKSKQESRVGLIPSRDGGFVTWTGGF